MNESTANQAANRLATLPEVAAVLGVGVRRLRELVKSGQVPACRIGRRWWRVSIEQAREALLALRPPELATA